MAIRVYNRAWQVIRGQKVFITVSVYFSKNIYIQRQTWSVSLKLDWVCKNNIFTLLFWNVLIT